MDKDILFYNELCERESSLIEEIKNLNETLNAFQILKKKYNKNVDADTVKDGIGTLITEPILDFKLELEEYDNKEAAIKEPIVKAEIKRRNRTGAIGYVLEALELIEQGTAIEVGKVFGELHPEFKDKEHKMAKNILSKLNAEGKVEAEKVEGKNYFLYKHKKEATLPLS